MMNLNNIQELEASTKPAIAYSTCYAQPSIELHHCENLELMSKMKNNSVDVILTDPPYLYLKKQKLEREFDEQLFFSECKRVLTKNGFIVLFGRGTSFYRWNTILANLEFNFKEEIIWNKSYGSSPLMSITRVHETITIYSKGNGKVQKVKVPYDEIKGSNLNDIHRDIKRIKTIISNKKAFENLEKYLFDGTLSFDGEYDKSTTISSGRKRVDRVVSTAQMIEEGMNEKTIITNIRDHYISIHPTQKPVRLLERLLALVIPKDKPREEVTVLDPFGGSFSTMEAVYNMQMKGISCEIDKEYFEAGKNRIERLPPIQAKLDLF